MDINSKACFRMDNLACHLFLDSQVYPLQECPLFLDSLAFHLQLQDNLVSHHLDLDNLASLLLRGSQECRLCLGSLACHLLFLDSMGCNLRVRVSPECHPTTQVSLAWCHLANILVILMPSQTILLQIRLV